MFSQGPLTMAWKIDPGLHTMGSIYNTTPALRHHAAVGDISPANTQIAAFSFGACPHNHRNINQDPTHKDALVSAVVA